MSGVTLKTAAKQLGKHRSTLSKWIKAGAPVLEEGTDGRGHTAIVDPDALMRWRAGTLALGRAQRNETDILRLMEQALIDTLKRDDLARRAKITDMQAGLVILLLYERCYRNLMKAPLTAEHVPEQLRRLCTVTLDSVEHGLFQRR